MTEAVEKAETQEPEITVDVPAIVEKLNPAEAFKPNGLEPALVQIEQFARSIDRDISTKGGRDNVRSVAAKIAKTKNALDRIGKDYGEGLRKQLSEINAERKRGVERLQVLQDEVRQPLTEYEEKEKVRIKRHEDAIAELLHLSKFDETPTSAVVSARLDRANEVLAREWEEFSDRATAAFNGTEETLNRVLQERRQYEKEQAELAELRAKEEERQRKEREEQIAKEAAEKARQESAEQVRLAEEKAAAAESEARAKLEAEEKARVAAEEKRAADLAHRKKINGEARDAIQKILAKSQDPATDIVTAIAKDEIPHVKITY